MTSNNKTDQTNWCPPYHLSSVWIIVFGVGFSFLFATSAATKGGDQLKTGKAARSVARQQEVEQEATQESTKESVDAVLSIDPASVAEYQRLVALNDELQLVYLTKGGRAKLQGEATGKAMLGVHVRQADETLRSQLGLKGSFGLVVEHVTSESGADAAGIQIHDVLWKLDDQMLVNLEQFQSLVEMKAAGDSVKLVYFRGGNPVDIDVNLTERKTIAKDATIMQLERYHQSVVPEQFVHSEAVLKFNNCSSCHTTIDGAKGSESLLLNRAQLLEYQKNYHNEKSADENEK